MSARLPDPARSRAVLIGAGTGHAELDLPRLPELRGQLTRLGGRLAGTVERPVTLANPRSVAKVRAAVRTAAAEAGDLLLVYCAGHVRSDQDGRPRLLLAGSVPGELVATAVALDELTGFVAASPAITKVLILDCGGWTVALPGTYILASGRSRTRRPASTAFTEALLAALDNPDPPSFRKLRSRIDHELVRRDEPKAQGKAASVLLLRGLADGQPVYDAPGAAPDRPVPNAIRIGTAPATVRRRQRRRIAGGTALLGLGALTAGLWLPPLVGVLGMLLFCGLFLLGAARHTRRRRGVATSLQFDATGITLHRLAADPVRVAWSDVITVGLLPPRAYVDERDHVLAVKLRPGASWPTPTPLVPGVDHLGCLGLARLGDLGITTHQLLARLDLFAEDKAAHSNRDWRTRHPELRGLLG